jgi:hypothetical protein
VENGRRNPAHFNRQVRQLFQAMADGGGFGEHQLRYFNGGLFDDDAVLDMDGDGVSILHGITALDWAAIEPAIFGTLFTRSLDPAQRAKLGAQYTSKEDILLIVEPVLMAPLRREWEQVRQRAQELVQKRDSAATRGAATRADNELRTLLLGFAQRLATIRVLDPACGSGNFLYVALRLLLDLWKEVAIFSAQAGLSILAPLPGLAPSPEQLYGIEINDYAHELAQATVWIGYFQWLHDNGYGFVSEPILKPLNNIRLMDAILAYDAEGQAGGAGVAGGGGDRGESAVFGRQAWVLEGASVRVSIVGFDDGSEIERAVDGVAVKTINADLTSGIDMTLAKSLNENAEFAFIGTQKTGPFELTQEQAAAMLKAEGNPNGRPNSDVIRPWLNGSDITGRPRNMWIIFFGEDMPADAAAGYTAPFDYLKSFAQPFRAQSRQQKLQDQWWIFEKPRPAMWSALNGLQRYIATPRVAKHRVFVFVDGWTVPDTRTVVFASDSDLILGILHSIVHEVWSLHQASRHGVGNDPTYNAQSCFETFPFPWPPGTEPTDDPRVQAIAAAAAELVAQRDAWLNPPGLSEKELQKRTLTNLYNTRPDWLDAAHRRLDAAVFAAYGWPEDLADEEMLARLLALNLERAG